MLFPNRCLFIYFFSAVVIRFSSASYSSNKKIKNLIEKLLCNPKAYPAVTKMYVLFITLLYSSYFSENEFYIIQLYIYTILTSAVEAPLRTTRLT